MANVKLEFLDEINDSISSTVKSVDGSIKVSIWYEETSTQQSIFLDISTAIKFAKTLRTEINKIKEVQNG